MVAGLAACLALKAQATETQTYVYDELGRLVSVASSGTINNGQKRSACFDPAGNRTRYRSDSAGQDANCSAGQAGLAIGNASVTEGGTLSFTVTRSGDTSSAVSVSYASASGTAVSGSDFTPVSGSISFAAGQTSAVVSVVTSDDTAVESAETMTVSLTGASPGAVITGATGTGTINDNDGAQPTYLAVSDAAALEGYTLVFTVTRSGNLGVSTTVNFATANGTAISNDYFAASGSITFAPGEASKTISVNAKLDIRAETDEVFYLNISGATGGAVITDSQGAGTIYDDGSGGCNLC